MINKVLITVAATLLPGCVALATPLSGSNPAEGQGVVYRVIDGDTFIINVNDQRVYHHIRSEAEGHDKRVQYLDDRYQSFRIRLANVNTPESTHPDDTRNTAEGRYISDAVKDMLEGEPVYFQCHGWGDYGRTICNMATYGNDQWNDFGYWLISEGYSPYVRHWGDNPYYHDAYIQAQGNVQ